MSGKLSNNKCVQMHMFKVFRKCLQVAHKDVHRECRKLRNKRAQMSPKCSKDFKRCNTNDPLRIPEIGLRMRHTQLSTIQMNLSILGQMTPKWSFLPNAKIEQFQVVRSFSHSPYTPSKQWSSALKQVHNNCGSSHMRIQPYQMVTLIWRFHT